MDNKINVSFTKAEGSSIKAKESEKGASEISIAPPEGAKAADTPKAADPKIISLGDKPAATPAAKADDSVESKGNAFTNIFNKQNEKQKEQDTNVISSVLKKEAGLKKLKPILGDVAIKKSLEQEKKAKLIRKLRFVQTAFVVSLAIAISSAVYFYIELSPSFDIWQNTTAKLEIANSNLRSIQTNINKDRYLAAQLDLNKFSYVSDDFLDKTSQLNNLTSTTAAKSLNSSVAQAALELPDMLTSIRENLSPDIVIPTVRSFSEPEATPQEISTKAEADLRAALMKERTKVTQGSELDESNREYLKLIDNTLKLIGNKALLASIKTVPIEKFKGDLETYIADFDPVKRVGLRDLMSSILSSTKSDIATIGAIKTNRIEWSTIIEQIEEVTIEVDPRSDLSDRALCKVLPICIHYNGFDFDTAANKIVLSGGTETTNADNFTAISDLIDELELSPNFKNVEMRSFSKTGTFESGFTASFKINLELETEDFSEDDKPIALEKRSVARKIGVKRN